VEISVIHKGKLSTDTNWYTWYRPICFVLTAART